MTETAASRDFALNASHFRRMWADRHGQTGTSPLNYRPGDQTDRYEMRRDSLRSCLRTLRSAQTRMTTEGGTA